MFLFLCGKKSVFTSVLLMNHKGQWTVNESSDNLRPIVSLFPSLTTRERCCRKGFEMIFLCAALQCCASPCRSLLQLYSLLERINPDHNFPVRLVMPSLQQKASWWTLKGVLNPMCSCCVSSSHCLRAAAFYIRGLLSFFQGRYNEAKYAKSILGWRHDRRVTLSNW